MGSTNISIIGAGSAVFSMRLVSDLCKTPGLSGSRVTLMDKDENRLKAVHVLARKLASELGHPIEFVTTKDIEKAVEGADFVINAALVGGHTFLSEIREIGERFGYYRGIDSQEFNMVSDYYTLTNWNQLEFMMKLAKLLETRSPNAWLLLAANPVLEGTTLLKRHTNANVVGFCHGFLALEEICRKLDLEFSKVDWQVAGVNHGIWLNHFSLGGTDSYKILKEKFSENADWRPSNPFDDSFSPAARYMLDFYGLMPIGDTIRNSSWAFHYDIETKKRWYGEPWGGVDSEEGWRWYTDLLGFVVKMFRELAMILEKEPEKSLRGLLKNVASELPEDLAREASTFFNPNIMSGEQHIPFINAIANDEKTRLVVNVLNNGTIRGLPDDIAIEAPAIVSSAGIKMEEIYPDLPERIIKWYLLPRILRMEWALEAFLKKDTSLITEVLFRDPRTKSREQAERAVAEVFRAARKYY